VLGAGEISLALAFVVRCWLMVRDARICKTVYAPPPPPPTMWLVVCTLFHEVYPCRRMYARTLAPPPENDDTPAGDVSADGLYELYVPLGLVVRCATVLAVKQHPLMYLWWSC